MLKKYITKLTKLVPISIFLSLSFQIYAQDSLQINQKNNFFENVYFGGNIGLSFGKDLSNIIVGPSVIYRFNTFFATGFGLQYNYLKDKNVLKSNMYGGSLITLVNPIDEIQLSVELEQLRVNNEFLHTNPIIKSDFWNTSLFLGAGYQQNKLTLGIRYNLLYNKNNFVYNQAWIPFVRIYF